MGVQIVRKTMEQATRPVLPGMRSGNKIWVEGAEMKTVGKFPCNGCYNATKCVYLKTYAEHAKFCPPLETVVGGEKSRREPFASDINHDEARDYRTEIVELSEATRKDHTRKHDQIMAMPDNTDDEIIRKSIACMLFFAMSKVKIMHALQISKSTFYRILGR